MNGYDAEVSFMERHAVTVFVVLVVLMAGTALYLNATEIAARFADAIALDVPRTR